MTTILVDANLGLMVSDSSISNDDRVWIGRKVFRYRGALLGFAGDCLEAEQFMQWWRDGCTKKPPHFKNSEALVLQASGVTHYLESCIPSPIKCGIEAIGSGSKAAICAYEALGHIDPRHAVAIVCKHDAGSRTPVRTYKLHLKRKASH